MSPEEGGGVAELTLDAGDAAELAELLRFLGDWLAVAEDDLAASLTRFVGRGGYDVGQLRGDLDRFTFLLCGDDGEPRTSSQAIHRVPSNDPTPSRPRSPKQLQLTDQGCPASQVRNARMSAAISSCR